MERQFALLSNLWAGPAPRVLAVLAVVLLLGGCIPTRHFRALSTTYEPLAPSCKLIERCDYGASDDQARCEMADLVVPEAGALAMCEEQTMGG